MNEEKHCSRIALRWSVAITTFLSVLGFMLLADLVSHTKGGEHDDFACGIFLVLLGLLVTALLGTIWMMVKRDKEPLWALMSAGVMQALMLTLVVNCLVRLTTHREPTTAPTIRR